MPTDHELGGVEPAARNGAGRRGWSVRTYLVLILVGAFVAVSAAVGYGFVWNANHARNTAFQQMRVDADRASVSISSSIATARTTVQGLAAQPGVTAVFAHPAGCTLNAAGSGPFPHLRVDLVSPTGQVACTSDRSPAVERPQVHAGSGWLRATLDSATPVVTWAAIDAATGQRSIAVSAPLTTNGAASGAAVMFLPLPAAAHALAHDLAGPEQASFVLLDPSAGAVLSQSTSPNPTTSAQAVRWPSSRTGEWSGLDGSLRYFASARIAGSDARVYAGVKRSVVLAAARGSLIREGSTAVLALLLLGVAVAVLNRKVAGPLRSLTDAVVLAGQNPEPVHVTEAGTSEIAALAREVNKMLDVRAGHEAQLDHLATHDPVTGLPNKTLLGDRLAHALRRDRDSTNVGVLFLGLNRFDTVTEGLGHETADAVLVELSSRLSAALRPGDTAARFSDDEFVVLCDEIASSDAARLADRLRACIREPFHASGTEATLHASIGVAIATDRTATPEQLLREAAAAMAEARTAGRGWTLFDAALHNRATHHLELERDLAQALQREEFVLHYQPILNVASGTIVGAEALLRWQHPERGLVPPLEFIPTAEQSGQIIGIGEHVLIEACKQTASWAARGHALRVSVNVSVDQLRDPGFTALVQRTLTATGLPADRLCLEITESTLIRETGPGWEAAIQLRSLGVHLAIDDFGTGYSSLAYLHQLPVNELKIDRAFINRLDRDPRDRHLVKAINGMAQALNLSVVAEGVETTKQLEILAEIGCNHAQGYLIAKPMPAGQFAELVQTRQPPRALSLAI
jgi:diguanylate cyclase (GGDEF)-like protein